MVLVDKDWSENHFVDFTKIVAASSFSFRDHSRTYDIGICSCHQVRVLKLLIMCLLGGSLDIWGFLVLIITLLFKLEMVSIINFNDFLLGLIGLRWQKKLLNYRSESTKKNCGTDNKYICGRYNYLFLLPVIIKVFNQSKCDGTSDQSSISQE